MKKSAILTGLLLVGIYTTSYNRFNVQLLTIDKKKNTFRLDNKSTIKDLRNKIMSALGYAPNKYFLKYINTNK